MAPVRIAAIDMRTAAEHGERMSRRRFLELAAGAAFAGVTRSLSRCTGLVRTPSPHRIRGICFDLFTLFDPRSILDTAAPILGEDAPAFCEAWRVRQFEYAWLRAASGRYADFRTVTADALDHVAEARNAAFDRRERDALVDAHSRLAPWPDTRTSLRSFRERGLALAPLANYAPSMMDALLARAELVDAFDACISTHEARTFKPDPRAYALGPHRLGLAREEIVFAAFGGWDAAGAAWFGFPTFWVNRFGLAEERLAPGADGIGADLGALASFVESRRSRVR